MLEFKNELNLDNEIIKNKKITNIISVISVILAINTIVWAICMFSLEFKLVYILLFFASLIAYILYLFFTYRFYVELKHKNNLKKVYFNHKMRRNNEYSKFFDTGMDLINKDDYKELDLDLFGKNSLFQYLSICKTKYGRLELKDSLTKIKEEDNNYTNAIDELAKREDTLDIEATLLEFNNEAKTLDYEIMYQTFGNKIKFKPLFILPLLSFIGMIIYIILIFALKLNPYFLFIFGFSNFALAKLCLKNDVYDIDSSKYYSLIDSYYYLSLKLINNNYENEYLKNIVNKTKESIINLKKLKGLLNLLSTRRNLLFNILSNVLLSFDFFVLIIFNIKTKNIIVLKDFFESIGKLECMMSLANIGIDNDVYTKPEEGSLDGIDIYHPLIPNCISNSFKLDGGVILTGSNMSGKTTFMRTLGICQTLYNAKGLIPAKSFKSKNLNIYTSLRANDMLSEGISTFYAEILRMKKINEAIEKEDVLVLIDEIFKGTNAKDRLEASFKVIEKLNNRNVRFIITTHDFELCDANNILNYHFNEEYINDKISFDYKIKDGKCETKNAIYLLKMANII